MSSNHRNGRSIWLYLALAAGAALAAWPAAAGAEEVARQTDEEIVLRVSLKDFELHELMSENGALYTTISGTGFVTLSEPGQPDLPGYSYLLAVPEGGSARLVSAAGSFETVATGVQIAPVQTPDTTFRGEEGFASFIYIEDPASYESGAAFPPSAVRVEPMGRMRGVDIARVAVSPFSYDPASGDLRVARDLTVTLRFEGAPGGGARRGSVQSGSAAGDSWERLMDRVLLNPGQGRKWQARRAPRILGRTVTNDRFKVEITETGIYRASYGALSDAGFPPGVAVEDIFVYRDEFAEGDPDTILVKECNILLTDANENGVFDGGDELVFYARDFYDEFGARWNQDLFFDRNVYWISWGDGEHGRMPERDGWPDMASPAEPAHFTCLQHNEEDLSFVQFPPHVSADWYYWEGYTWTVPFDLPGIHTGYPAELRVNFIGYLITGQNALDEIVLSLTGCSAVEEPVDTVDYWLPGMRNFTVPLEAGLLCETGNSFKFRATVTTSPGSCLDWFELTYQRKYEAYEDYLEFTSGDSLGEIEISVDGFSAGDLALFDVTDPYAVSILDVPPENISENEAVYGISFRDSISDTTSYVAVRLSAATDIAAGDIEKTTAPLLRTTPADYLIVCHPDFADAVQTLVEHRESQGHTVLFATTGQVYDDFNNGLRSDEAVRRFIEYGFFTYGSEFVLLVGDSNVDRRGLLLDHPSDPSDVDYVSSRAFLQRDRQGRNFEIWPSEMWFAMVDGPEDRLPDIYLGRLPVGSQQEINGAIEKILNYESSDGSDEYKKRVLCIADDQFGRGSEICWTGQVQFMRSCDSVAVIAADMSVIPPDTIKYYLERCTTDDQPELRCELPSCCTTTFQTMSYTRFNCTPDVKALLEDGALFVNFQGHANENVLTHETLIREDISENDVMDLGNDEAPFAFFGFGCYIANFHRFRERQVFIQDCIGEKFMVNPNGAASAAFASACAEPISGNERFNPFVAHAMFDYLTPYDPHGNPVEARVLIGEVAMTALLRYGSISYIDRHALFGDPAMRIDMGAPLMTTTVNDSLLNGEFVFAGDEPETLLVVSDIRDNEAIMSTAIDLVEADRTIPVPGSALTEEALMDTQYVRGRAYRVTYEHVPGLGHYTVRLKATDYAGHEATSEFEVATGGAEYFKEGTVLEEGGTVVIDQTLRVLLSRPEPFSEGDIDVRVDTIPAGEFDEYEVEMADAEGRQWEVSFVPALGPGEHTILASAEGFQSERGFVYVPGDIEFFVDGRPLYENDFVSAEPVLEVLVKGTVDPGVVDVTLDGEEPDSLWYAPDTSTTSITVGLTQQLQAGNHELEVSVEDVGLARMFRVSDDFGFTEVSAYPVPFSDFTYIYYTLTSEAAEARLEIFTVAGRKIYEDRGLTPYAGYNVYRWDGRDSAGDEIANGTYIYKLTVKSGSGEQEFTAPIARLK